MAVPQNNVALTFYISRFLQFDLEDSDNCNRDYVEIHRDSAEGPILGHFCGNSIPANVTTAEKLWIKFNSDSANTAGGFIAHYNLRELIPTVALLLLLTHSTVNEYCVAMKIA